MVMLNLPSEFAMPLPTVSPLLSTITTVLPGSVVPETIVPSLLIVGLVTAEGGVVSTVNGGTAVAVLTLPSASVWVIVRLCSPSPNGVFGVKLQVPLLATSVLPSSTPLLS